MTRPQPRYQPGDRIADRYQVHQVKMGGMGEVYLCLDLEEMNPYALKTFQQRYQSDALRQAFETEVTTWVTLEKHPNIVRCFHMRTLDNQPFMILEWVSGEEGRGTDLRSHLRYGSMSLNQSLKIILDLCYGLQHAQDKQPGLVHRDLKPENILVAQGGQVKITDFGLAQIVSAAELVPDDDARMTGAGQTMMSQKGIAGTPSYMAPEQWRGETLDPRTDIYAFGCIWVELLTGQPPFTVDYHPTSPDEVEQWLSALQQEHEQAKRSDLVAALPTVIHDLIQACLAQDPAERPASLAQLIDQVQALYPSLMGQTSPPPPIPGEMTAGDYTNRGDTYADLGQHDQAMQDFNRAIKLDPSLVQAYINRGVTYKDLGQHDQAMQDFNRAIKLDPSNAHAYYNRGVIYKGLGQTDYALDDNNQAIKLDPSLVQAYINRGVIYHALGQHDQAMQDYNQAIKLGPSDAQAYSNRGLTYAELGQHDQALQDYTQAIKLDPSDALAYLGLGALLGNQGKLDEALPYFEKAAQLGDPKGAQYAAQARQMLTQGPEPEVDPAQAAFDSFVQAASLDEMRHIANEHPMLLEAEFIEAITQALTEIPAENQPTYQQCLTWLQQIIQEQAQ